MRGRTSAGETVGSERDEVGGEVGGGRQAMAMARVGGGLLVSARLFAKSPLGFQVLQIGPHSRFFSFIRNIQLL